MNDGSFLSLVILYCVHCPTANGIGANMPGAGGGTAVEPACSTDTRRSMSALAAGSIEGPHAPDDRTTAAAVTTNSDGTGRVRMAAMVPNRAAPIKRAALTDRQQLDVENQRPGGRARAGGLVAVGERARNPEAHLVADDHQLDAFRPALDDAVQREAGRLAAFHRAVEHLSVRGPAAVVHLDGAVLFRVFLALAVLQELVGEARRRALGV